MDHQREISPALSLSSILHAFQITDTCCCYFWGIVMLLDANEDKNTIITFFLLSNLFSPRTEQIHTHWKNRRFLQNLKTFFSASGDVLKCVFGLRGYEQRIPSSIQQGMCVTYFSDYSVFDIDYKRPTTTTTAISVRTEPATLASKLKMCHFIASPLRRKAKS